MKHLTLLVLALVLGSSSLSFAKDAPHKRKLVVISFSESDAKGRGPASLEEKEIVAAQARHVAQAQSLDAALLNLN